MNVNTTTQQNVSTLPVMESFYTIQGEDFIRVMPPISSGLVVAMWVVSGVT